MAVVQAGQMAVRWPWVWPACIEGGKLSRTSRFLKLGINSPCFIPTEWQTLAVWTVRN